MRLVRTNVSGLQEPEVGKQCEAILFLTKIIAKFPFPIVVNTAVLKLASVFKNRFGIPFQCTDQWVAHKSCAMQSLSRLARLLSGLTCQWYRTWNKC